MVSQGVQFHLNALYSEWIGNDRHVRAILAEMREVAAKAQQLMLEETQSKAG